MEEVQYTITEDDLAFLTGLSPRTVRTKFKPFKIGDRQYDYQEIFQDAVIEKYSNANKEIFVNQDVFARILGVTDKTIQNYKNKKILLPEQDGKFNLLINLERVLRENNEYNKILKVKREREEIRKQRDLMQLDIEEEKYIPRHLYSLILKDLITSFRQEFLRTATYLSINLKTIPAVRWKEYIRKTLNETLEELAKIAGEVEERINEEIDNEYSN